MVEFRIYEKVIIMPLEEFCGMLGVWNVGKSKMPTHPTELKALFASLCSKDPKDIHRKKISNIFFPHQVFHVLYFLRGVVS